MKDSIPELEALRLLLEQCRHVVVSQGQDAFKQINAKAARHQADRLDLLGKAEDSLDAFENALGAFPELFVELESSTDTEPPTVYREVKNESVISQDALGQKATITSSAANATGYWDGRRFTIEAGSQMRADEVPSIHEWLREHRASLLAGGVVIKQASHYVFIKSAVFTSPSAAAGVVLGRSANGPQEWKLPDGSPLGKMTPKDRLRAHMPSE